MPTAPGPGSLGLLPPNQNLTPPLPTMNGTSNNININPLGANKFMSAAPGAEAKYSMRNGPMNGAVLGFNNSGGFQNRVLPRK